jgi:hypothetical protein
VANADVFPGSKTLTFQQLPWGLVVEVNVVKWVGDDFCHPNNTRLKALQEEQMHRAKQQS